MLEPSNSRDETGPHATDEIDSEIYGPRDWNGNRKEDCLEERFREDFWRYDEPTSCSECTAE